MCRPCRESLAFATEPVFASLANVLGQTENVPAPVPAALRDHQLHQVEIRYGLLQVRARRQTDGREYPDTSCRGRLWQGAVGA